MNTATTKKFELSVIIPVTERYDPVSELYHEYKRAIESTGENYEFIYVLDGENPEVLKELNQLQTTDDITVIALAKRFGEATALNAAFSQASGDVFLTLPAYQQVEADEIPKIIKSLEDCDMVLARRCPRSDSIINRMQARMFNFLLRFSTDLQINDAGCSVRAFTRKIIEDVQLYGDLHRFFPSHRSSARLPCHRDQCCTGERRQTPSHLFTRSIRKTIAGSAHNLLPHKIHQETIAFFRSCRHDIICLWCNRNTVPGDPTHVL